MPFDEMDAASFMVGSYQTSEVIGGKVVWEPSPFAQTRAWGVFYSDCDPKDLLHELEIESAERVPKMRRGRNGALREPGD